MIVVSTVLICLSFGAIAWTVIDVATGPRQLPVNEGRFEVQRRDQLRSACRSYRWMEPLIDEWSTLWRCKPAQISNVDECLHAAGVREPWKPVEYVCVKRAEGILVAMGLALVGSSVLGMNLLNSMIVAGVSCVGYQWLAVRTLKSQALLRQTAMKRRFANAIDLMALMMEVGADFHECLEVAARENKNSPLGEELSLVQKEITMGSLRSKALKGMAERTRDIDMSEVVMSINEGEELGTPLTNILRNQAEQMRKKRSQWAEKAAEEAQVAIVFPAMLIMIACLLIVVAPFVVTVISGEGT